MCREFFLFHMAPIAVHNPRTSPYNSHKLFPACIVATETLSHFFCFRCFSMLECGIFTSITFPEHALLTLCQKHLIIYFRARKVASCANLAATNLQTLFLRCKKPAAVCILQKCDPQVSIAPCSSDGGSLEWIQSIRFTMKFKSVTWNLDLIWAWQHPVLNSLHAPC